MRIVAKVLRKNKDERYQNIKDLLLDLKSLKESLALAAELERSAPPSERVPEGRGTKIAIFPFEGGEPLKLFDFSQNASPGTPQVRWLPDGRALAFVSTRGGVSNIWLQPIDGGAPTQLTDFKTDVMFSFDWSRDGKQLALSRGTEQRDVVLMTEIK